MKPLLGVSRWGFTLAALGLPPFMALHPIELEGFRPALTFGLALFPAGLLIGLAMRRLTGRARMILSSSVLLLSVGSCMVCLPYWLLSYAYHPFLMPAGVAGSMLGLGVAAAKRRVGRHWLFITANWMTFADVMTFRIPYDSERCTSLFQSSGVKVIYDNARADHPALESTIPYDFVVDPALDLLAVSHESVFWRTRKAAAVTLRSLSDGRLRSILQFDQATGRALYAEKLALDPARRHLYVSTNGPEGFMINQVDLTQREAKVVRALPVAGEIHEMETVGDRLVVLYWESKRGQTGPPAMGEVFGLPDLTPLKRIEAPVPSYAPGSLHWNGSAFWFALPGPALGRTDAVSWETAFFNPDFQALEKDALPSRLRGGVFPPASAVGNDGSSYVASPFSGRIRACRAGGGEPCAEREVGGMPRALLLDEETETLLAGGYASGEITAFSAADLTPLGRLWVGRLIRRLRTGPDHSVYALSECGVVRVDAPALNGRTSDGP